MSAAWPADPQLLDAALARLRGLPAGARVAVASDGDADGLCAGALAMTALERAGLAPVWLVAGRGEYPHRAPLRERIAATAPALIVVLDMGAQPGTIVPGIPTIVVDHHAPSGVPDGALLVTAYGHPPVAPTSLLAYHLFGRLAPLEDHAWIAVLGTYADQGDPSLPGLAEGLERHGKTAIADASALLNAARRAPAPDPEVAARVLRAATCAQDIARGRVPEVDRLEQQRRAVAAEVKRCGAAAPRFAPPFVLVSISSPAKIHALLATRWARRLGRFHVLVANHGFAPGLISVAMRTALDVDLVALLRGLDLPLEPGSELGHGHPAATGGSLTPGDFARLLARLGFDAGQANARR